MIRRVWTSLILLIALGLGWSFVQGESDSSRKKKGNHESALMRAKLASSQMIVEGLVNKDFKGITRGAEELLRICYSEEWEAHPDEILSHHRKELIRQAEKIVNAADRENLDGAAYSYIHALTTCISCHDHCRDVLKITDGHRALKVVPIPTTAEDDDKPLPGKTTR
jgi:hypothetical protein